MKFILNEELTLDEKNGISDSGKKWSLSDDELYAKLQHDSYSQKEAERTVNTILKDEEAGNASDRGYWNKKYNSAKTDSTEDSTEEQPKQEQSEETAEQENQQSQSEEQSVQIDDTSNEQWTSSATANKLLTIVKSSNKNGFNNFLKGIKGNISNSEFPFVKLMSNPEFSYALGIKESLEEGIFDNLGDKLNKLKVRVSPNTFVNFASVYNAFLDNDKDIKSTNYVNDKDAIVYKRDLYKLKPEGIKRAIEYDVAAANIDDEELKKNYRERLEDAVSSGNLSKIGKLKAKGDGNQNNLKSVVNATKSLSDDDQKALYDALHKKFGGH